MFCEIVLECRKLPDSVMSTRTDPCKHKQPNSRAVLLYELDTTTVTLPAPKRPSRKHGRVNGDVSAGERDSAIRFYYS